jgi:hypothetical protein
MSHRLTIETKITNREAAEAALNQANIKFDSAGDSLYLKTGQYKNTEINLKTGAVTSDTDYIDRGKLGLLRQFYAEAIYRQECAIEGIQILNRQEVVENGETVIILRCQTA